MGNSVSHCEEAILAETPVEEVEEVEVEEVVEVEEPPAPKKEIIVDTAAIDPRFPVTNQSRHCFVKYNEAHKCWAEKGEGDAACAQLARDYRSICPQEWLAAWNEARENGAWWGRY